MMRTLESNVNDSISDNFRPTCQRNDRKIRKCRANRPPASLASLLANQISRIFGTDRCWPVSWQIFAQQPVSLTVVFTAAATAVIAMLLRKR